MDLSSWITILVTFGIPMVIGVFFGRSIFSQKHLNPMTGAIIGGLAGALTSVLGLIIFYLVISRWPSFKTYALYRGGPKRLEVSWTYGFGKAEVKLDQISIGTLTRQEAKQGRSFRLPDGSILDVKAGRDPSSQAPAPVLALNGNPVPDSIKDPVNDLKFASASYIATGAFIFVAGILLAGDTPPLFTVYNLVIGLAAVITGIFIRRVSRTALWVGLAITIISILVTIVPFFTGAESFMEFVGDWRDLIETAVFAFGLRKGFKAVSALELEGVKRI